MVSLLRSELDSNLGQSSAMKTRATSIAHPACISTPVSMDLGFRRTRKQHQLTEKSLCMFRPPISMNPRQQRYPTALDSTQRSKPAAAVKIDESQLGGTYLRGFVASTCKVWSLAPWLFYQLFLNAPADTLWVVGISEPESCWPSSLSVLRAWGRKSVIEVPLRLTAAEARLKRQSALNIDRPSSVTPFDWATRP